MRSLIFFAGLLTGVAAAAADAPPQAVQRWWEGSYEYRNLGDGATFGVERFRLTLHPDGTRTLVTWNDNRARATQINAVLRVDASFRPLEAYAAYWQGGQWRGSVNVHRTADGIRVSTSGPDGTASRVEPVPGSFSLSLHPVAVDGLHVAAMPAEAATAQLLAVNPAADGGIATMLVPMPLERKGVDAHEVPAGRFEALHVKLAGANDLWILPDEFIVLREVVPRVGAEYVLTSLARGEGLAGPGASPCIAWSP